MTRALAVMMLLALAGCAKFDNLVGKLTPYDCRNSGCNPGAVCIEGEEGRPWRCSYEAEPDCVDAPKCPKGEVPELKPFKPGGCAYTGKCVKEDQ